MSVVQLELEDDLAALLHGANRPIEQTARELIILELYRQGKVSSGKAAQLLGMPRWEFVPFASRLGLPFFDMTADEWEVERNLVGSSNKR
jgi:predicted HTH domain antitoxin